MQAEKLREYPNKKFEIKIYVIQYNMRNELMQIKLYIQAESYAEQRLRVEFRNYFRTAETIFSCNHRNSERPQFNCMFV